MKRAFSILLGLLLAFSPAWAFRAGADAPEEIQSQTAVLMDLDTGQVLYDKAMDQRVYPASTTKVLTALVVLENARPYEIVTVNQSALDDITWDSSHIALTAGEQFTVDSGLYALMLPSANDAANALAEHVAGSLEAFADMMNAKAQQIGAHSSHFTNAHGLHNAEHYTTAYDMALITRYAMQNEQFRDYFGAARYTMPETNLNGERPFTNYQYMLVKETGYYDPTVVGGKVGLTSEAQNTMTTVATRGGRSLVCAVMGSPLRGDKFEDTEALLNFGFGEFVPFSISREAYSNFRVPVLEQDQVVGSATFTAGSDFTALLHVSVDPGDVAISFHKAEALTTELPITCSVSFDIANPPGMVPSTLGTMELAADVRISVTGVTPPDAAPEESFRARVLKAAAIVAGGLLLLFASVVAWRRHQIRKRRKARQARLDKKRREAERYSYGSPSPSSPAAARGAGRRSADYPAAARGSGGRTAGRSREVPSASSYSAVTRSAGYRSSYGPTGAGDRYSSPSESAGSAAGRRSSAAETGARTARTRIG